MLEIDGRPAAGQGVATDILEAAARAYVRALSVGVQKAQGGDEVGAPELAPAP